MKKLLILSMLVLAFSFTSCSSDSADPVVPDPPNTYSGTIKGIIDGNCIGCHSDPPVNNAPIPLTTLAQVKAAVEGNGLIGRVESGSMPPNGALTAKQIQNLKDWQTAGFPQ